MKRKLKIIYYKDKCRGLGMCATIAPHTFVMKRKKAALIDGSETSKDEYRSTASLSKKDADKSIKSALACPVNAIRVVDMKTKKELIPSRITNYGAERITADPIGWKDFVMDRKGYFLIRVDRKKRLIEVGLCRSKNHIDTIITGKNPADIYYAISRRKLISRTEHAAYLGKELQKAYTAMELGIEYVQDSPLDFSKHISNNNLKK